MNCPSLLLGFNLAIVYLASWISNDHSSDEKVFNHYSLEERTSSTVLVIDRFLAEKDYKKVVLVGASEGAGILPKVYNSLVHRDEITKLIPLNGGGLSQYEKFKIMGRRI